MLRFLLPRPPAGLGQGNEGVTRNNVIVTEKQEGAASSDQSQMLQLRAALELTAGTAPREETLSHGTFKKQQT